MIHGYEFRDAATANKYPEEECPTDPWGDCLGLSCGGYNSEVTNDILAVMRVIIDDRPAYVTDIAEKTGLLPKHVELIQYILCSADLCEYGTSPRGCWAIDDDRFRAAMKLIEEGNPLLNDPAP